MADSAYTSPSSTRPPRKRQFPFGLVMLAFGLGLGFYGGVAATKRAMTSPAWVQNVFGVHPAAAVTPPTVAPTPPPITVAPPPVQPPITSTVPPANPDSSSAVQPVKPVKPTNSNKTEKPDTRDLTGRWEITDSLPAQSGPSSSVTSAYVFNSDNSGQFDSNGKKMYDFNWKPSGDDISITYNGEGPDPDQEWTVKLKWSLNDDHSVLTLIPESGKDARSYLYALGPGVYHKK